MAFSFREWGWGRVQRREWLRQKPSANEWNKVEGICKQLLLESLYNAAKAFLWNKKIKRQACMHLSAESSRGKGKFDQGD